PTSARRSARRRIPFGRRRPCSGRARAAAKLAGTQTDGIGPFTRSRPELEVDEPNLGVRPLRQRRHHVSPPPPTPFSAGWLRLSTRRPLKAIRNICSKVRSFGHSGSGWAASGLYGS